MCEVTRPGEARAKQNPPSDFTRHSSAGAALAPGGGSPSTCRSAAALRRERSAAAASRASRRAARRSRRRSRRAARRTARACRASARSPAARPGVQRASVLPIRLKKRDASAAGHARRTSGCSPSSRRDSESDARATGRETRSARKTDFCTQEAH